MWIGFARPDRPAQLRIGSLTRVVRVRSETVLEPGVDVANYRCDRPEPAEEMVGALDNQNVESERVNPEAVPNIGVDDLISRGRQDDVDAATAVFLGIVYADQSARPERGAEVAVVRRKRRVIHQRDDLDQCIDRLPARTPVTSSRARQHARIQKESPVRTHYVRLLNSLTR